MAFSEPAPDGDTHFAGEANDVGHQNIDHAQDPIIKEAVFVGL